MHKKQILPRRDVEQRLHFSVRWTDSSTMHFWYLVHRLFGLSCAVILSAASPHPNSTISSGSLVPPYLPTVCFLNSDWTSPQWPIRVLRFFNDIFYSLLHDHTTNPVLEFLPTGVVPETSLSIVRTPYKLVNGKSPTDLDTNQSLEYPSYHSTSRRTHHASPNNYSLLLPARPQRPPSFRTRSFPAFRAGILARCGGRSSAH